MIIRKYNRFHWAALVFLIWSILQAFPLAAQAPVLGLTGPTDINNVAPFVQYYKDDDWSQTVEGLAGPDADQFLPVTETHTDFGYTKARIWLRAKVRNDTPDTSDWFLYFQENFKQIINVHAVRPDGHIETLLSLHPESPFGARPIQFPEMVAPLVLKPGEQVSIIIGLWSEGASHIEFSIEDRPSFAAVSNTRIARNSVFYGMMLLLIATAMVSLLFFKNLLFLSYSAYATSALLYIMHVDGVAFQYLWPNWPLFNSKASVFTGSGIIVFGAIYARMFLKTKMFHPVMDKVLLAVIGINFALVITLFFPNPQLLKKALVFLSMIAIICFAVTGIVAALSRFKEVRFYLFAWVGAVVSVVMLNLNHIFGIEMPQLFLYDSIRAVMVFDAAMMGLAIADRYNQLRQSRQHALESSLDEAQRNLDLSERLAALEERYQTVSGIARNRDVEMQNTVHDLRQPLHALRLSVQGLIRNGRKNTDTGHVDQTFQYLEKLMGDFLNASVKQDFDHETPSAQAGEETISVPDVLRSVHEMFLPDAAEKSLRFDFESEDVVAPVDPLALMRILTNLVANAIKYTDNGGVALRGQAHPPQIIVEDSGPGLGQEAFAAAQTREVRLGDLQNGPEGHGLGLSIAMDLARKNGLGLSLDRTTDTGTRLILTL